MTVGERIKALREALGISQVDFATRINVSKQTLYKYENNLITNIPSDKIEAAARIGNVSPAYLMGWEAEEPDKASPALTRRDERDIEKILDQTREQLLSQEGLMFDGNPASPEAVESILSAMQIGMELAKKKNKEKYTPKKYKKD